jgi:hypothetical protein
MSARWALFALALALVTAVSDASPLCCECARGPQAGFARDLVRFPQAGAQDNCKTCCKKVHSPNTIFRPYTSGLEKSKAKCSLYQAYQGTCGQAAETAVKAVEAQVAVAEVAAVFHALHVSKSFQTPPICCECLAPNPLWISDVWQFTLVGTGNSCMTCCNKVPGRNGNAGHPVHGSLCASTSRHDATCGNAGGQVVV